MFDFSVFLQPDAWLALLTLTLMEIVLGIDNIVFISIITDRLPPSDRGRARTIGLALALFTRLALLAAISWIMGLEATLFSILGQDISGRDLILGVGGLFLMGKATHEIFEKLEVGEDKPDVSKPMSMFAVIVQILILDLVFSLDSVITAVGMAEHLPVMMVAVVIAVGVMLLAAGSISEFISRYPSMKVLALSFLILIGVLLTAEALGQHINKGYIYFAMAFSLAVELINIRTRKDSAKKGFPASEA